MGTPEHIFLILKAKINLSKKAGQIYNLLKSLEKVESEEGIDSEKFKSECGLLLDFLAEEKEAAENFKKLEAESDSIFYAASQVFGFDPVIIAHNDDHDAKLDYRSDFFISPPDEIAELTNEEICAELLRRVKGSTIKYELAFTVPSLCADLASANFDVSNIYPEIQTASLSPDLEKKRSNYIASRCKSLIEMISTSPLDEDDILYDYLAVISSKLPETAIDAIISYLANAYISEDIRNRLKEIKEILKRKNRQIEIQE